MRIEIAALDELHGEVVLPFMLADFVDGHDVRMIQPRRRLRLALKAGDLLRRGELPGPDALQGDDAIEADLPGLVDDAHAAAADLLQQFVIAKRLGKRITGGTTVRSPSISSCHPCSRTGLAASFMRS